MQPLPKTGAAVVVFNPDWELFKKTFQTYSPYFSQVWVVANSMLQNEQQDWLEGQQGVKIIQNKENLGLGAALNQAFIQVKSAGLDWMLTMDQDSGFEQEGVQHLINGLCSLSNQTAAYGANPLWHPHVGHIRSEKKVLIQSGTFWRISAWNAVGGFHEGLFVDGVDHEFCLRCRKLGWQVHTQMNVPLVHALGKNLKVPAALWRLHPWAKSGLTYYGPAREYYLIRNTTWLIASFLRSEPVWSLRRLGYLIQRLLYALFILPDKKDRLRAIWRAFKDVKAVPPRSGLT